jgi:hypothetical protein
MRQRAVHASVRGSSCPEQKRNKKLPAQQMYRTDWRAAVHRTASNFPSLAERKMSGNEPGFINTSMHNRNKNPQPIASAHGVFSGYGRARIGTP